MSTIGQLSRHQSRVKCSVEWTIGDIFAVTERDRWYYSPDFDIAGSEWYLEIRPQGNTKNNSVGWISLYLHRRKNVLPPQSVNYNFGLKKADGEVEKIHEDLSWVFGNKVDSSGYGFPKFLEISKMLQRQSELAPEDVLTVTCDLQVGDDFDHASRVAKLSESFEDMLISKRLCDATLKVQQQEFAVHRCILATRSPVFARMFEVDMKEKETGVVDIVDCDPTAFGDFLMYLYSGKFHNLSKKVSEVYKIADKYGVDDLKSDCAIFIGNNLTVKNVLDAAVLGDQFDEEELKSKTQDFFIKNVSEIILSAKWDSFSKENNTLANHLLKNMAEKMQSEKIKPNLL